MIMGAGGTKCGNGGERSDERIPTVGISTLSEIRNSLQGVKGLEG